MELGIAKRFGRVVAIFVVLALLASVVSVAGPQPASAAANSIESSGPAVVPGSSLKSTSPTATDSAAPATTVAAAPVAPINNPPDAPVLVAPSDAATGVSTSPLLTVTVSDPDGDRLSVSFYGRAQGSDVFALVDMVAGIASGADATVTWASIGDGQTFEWYASVSDGSQTTQGPTWTFQTVFATDPTATTLVEPSATGTGVTLPPSPDATVSDPANGLIGVTSVSPVVNALTAPGAFTIVVYPDTQFYSLSHPATYLAQSNWVVANETALNIKYVAHLGDIVESNDGSQLEWDRASAAHDILEAAAVPYGVVPGNHDIEANGVGALYDATFPPSRFAGKPWYGGYLGDSISGVTQGIPSDGVPDSVDRLNKDNYQIINVGALRFVFIGLEYGMPQFTLDWAQDVIDAQMAINPDTEFVLVTHNFITNASERPTSPTRSNGQSAEYVWQNLITNNCQIHLVLNGHYSGEGRRRDLNDCDEPVHQLLADYQRRANGGDGWLRYMTFRPADNEIDVFTYSPTRNGGSGEFEIDTNSQFTIDFDMTNPAAALAVSYDGNTSTGGTDPVDPSSPYASGATVTVLGAGSLVKAGYTFAGWNTQADGLGTAYAASDTFVISANTTLYARWVADNQAPTDILLSSSSVAENEPSGSVVGVLSTVDPDVADSHSYALVSGAGDTDNASFAIVGDELRTAAVFDFETRASYSVRVQTSDSGSLTFSKVLTVTVTNVNEAPSVTSPATVSVAENQTGAIDVAASDPEGETEGGGGLTYSFTTSVGGVDNGLFNLDAATGVVTFLSAPDFEIPGDSGGDNVYDIEVTVTDSGALSGTQTIAITVTDVDDVAPAVPVGLVASPGDGQVGLDWADNTEPDLASYSVFRSTASGGPYGAALVSGLVSSDYVDTTVTNGVTYYYVVTATDAVLNESGFSDEKSATPLGVIDFSGVTFESYAGQDVSGGATVSDGGATVTLAGNTWKKFAFPYTVTANTVLEFDFSSSREGEIHGIGFDTDNVLSPDQTFQLFGTQTWGLQNYKTYVSPGVVHYTIPVGQFYTGSFTHLILANDHDLGTPKGDSTFTNVKVSTP